MNRTHRIAAASALLLGACAPSAPPAAPTLLAFADHGCPRTIDTTIYSVGAHRGPDYTICELTPTRAGVPRVELRVGGIWAMPERARFAGFTSTPVGPIAWFDGSVRGPKRVQVAFVPTGVVSGTLPLTVMVVYEAGATWDSEALRDEVLTAVVRGAMKPGNAITPAPPASAG